MRERSSREKITVGKAGAALLALVLAGCQPSINTTIFGGSFNIGIYPGAVTPHMFRLRVMDTTLEAEIIGSGLDIHTTRRCEEVSPNHFECDLD